MNKELFGTLLMLKAKPPSFDPDHVTQEQKLLLLMVHRCLEKAPKGWGRRAVHLRPEDAETLFERVLAGNVDRRSARQFLSNLFWSDDFYEKLKPLLHAASADPQKDLPSNAHLLPDETLLTIALAASRKPRRALSSVRLPVLPHMTKLPALRRAWIMAVPAVILLAATIFFPKSHPVFAEYFMLAEEPFFSETLEAPVHRFRLRSPTVFQQGAFDRADTQFDSALALYLAKEYKRSLKAFSRLENDPAFSNDHPERRLLFLFYRGMAHLGAAGDRPLWNRRHLARAERSLEEAYRLGQSLGRSPDELTFFLGMTYGLRGNRAAADTLLSTIPPQSRFYESARRLIHN